MSWIRLDCSILDDEFLIEALTGDEFKAWSLFLIRVKALGARGSVAITSTKSLSRNWNVPEGAILSMLEKAAKYPNGDGKPGQRIYEDGGRWYVKNWKKYQEDYKHANIGKFRGPSSENSGDPPDGTTPPHNNPTITPQDRTRDRARPDSPSTVETYLTEIGCPNPSTEAAKFFDHFESNGWKVGGKAPMKSWKASARTWTRNINEFTKGKPSGYNKNQSGTQAARATYRPTPESRADDRSVGDYFRRNHSEGGERS